MRRRNLPPKDMFPAVEAIPVRELAPVRFDIDVHTTTTRERPELERAMGNRQSVLLVHAEDDFRRHVRKSLMEAGYNVEAADSRPKALERLFAEPQPHIILVQEELPGTPGSELIAEAYQYDLTKGLKVALLAERQVGVAERRMLRLDAFIRKPVEPVEVVRVVRGLSRNIN